MPYNRIENVLRKRARELIGAGFLPCGPPMHVWGGYGSELACSLCEELIPHQEVEYELEFRGAHSTQLYRFHFLCHTAWSLECARAETPGETNED